MSGVLFLVNGGLGVDPGLLLAIPRMTAVGAQRQHVTLPTGFRSPSENSHSRYLTARFAP